jgi:hypothetical protein
MPVLLTPGDHALAEREEREILDELEAFSGFFVARKQSSTASARVLFTDIVGSLRWRSSLGDGAGLRDRRVRA